MYTNDKDLIYDNFRKLLRKSIADEFGFEGVPVRLLLCDNKLQYARKSGTAYLNAITRAFLERIRMYN